LADARNSTLALRDGLDRGLRDAERVEGRAQGLRTLAM
jgi:hypothetical protein